jgi:drug/metabolite transporter (DMT)-like permease
MAAARPMTALEWSLLIALSLLWGCTFFFTKVALQELPPLVLVFARVALAALALAPFALAGAVLLDRRLWPAFLVMGAINNLVPFFLLSWAQQHVSSGLAAILNGATPLFSVLVAHWLTREEKATPAKLAGVLVGFAGLAVMVGPSALAGLGAGLEFVAQLACLGACVSYSVAAVYGRRFRGLPPLGVAAGQLAASALMLAPLVALAEAPWTLPAPSLHTWAALGAFAFAGTALAYVLYFRLLASAGATNVLLVTFLVPVGALLLSVWALHEPLGWRQLAGMALIGVGRSATDGRLWRRRPRGLWRVRPRPTLRPVQHAGAQHP